VYEGIFVVVSILSYKPFFFVFQVFWNLFLVNQKVITFDFFCSSFFICIVTRVLFEGVFCCFSFVFINLFLVFQEFHRPIIRWKKGNNFRVFFSFFFILHMYCCLCCCLNVFYVCFYFVFIIFFLFFRFSTFLQKLQHHSHTHLPVCYTFFLRSLSSTLYSSHSQLLFEASSFPLFFHVFFFY